ncbi:MAG TPA: hypothetical protein VE568_08455, partial [Rubrobacter sp.]|nr:hypothetical protein [Rubrobacter sp.]
FSGGELGPERGSPAIVARKDGREVRTMLGDTRDVGAFAAEGTFEAASCMGATLTHLESFDEVSTLVSDL